MKRYTLEGLPNFCKDLDLEVEIDTDQNLYDLLWDVTGQISIDGEPKVYFMPLRGDFGMKVRINRDKDEATIWFIGIDENNCQIIFSDQERPPIPRECYYVNVYLDDLGYGGPEEGGWYYDVSEVREINTVSTWDEAIKLKRELEEGLFSNEGRPSIHSVLSRGQYRVMIEANPGESEPKRKPDYC